jgi:outer membrane biosynthesis protein TonB
VYVRVSATGCPTKALLAVSSGYPGLDAAALLAMLDSNYEPAEVDGHPVAKGSSQKFVF